MYYSALIVLSIIIGSLGFHSKFISELQIKTLKIEKVKNEGNFNAQEYLKNTIVKYCKEKNQVPTMENLITNNYLTTYTDVNGKTTAPFNNLKNTDNNPLNFNISADLMQFTIYSVINSQDLKNYLLLKIPNTTCDNQSCTTTYTFHDFGKEKCVILP